MKLTIFLPLAAFLSWAIAETTDCTDDASPCLLRCMSEAAVVAGCASSDDTDCTCPSAAFKEELGSCLQDSCTEDDITAAGELHKERCGTTPSE